MKRTRSKVLLISFLLMMVMVIAGCSDSGGPSSIGPDQSDPKKVAEYVVNELVVEKNGKVLEKYASYKLKKQIDREKGSVENLRKTGYASAKGYVDRWDQLRKYRDNQRGRIVSHGITEMKPRTGWGDSKERMDVIVWQVRERHELDDFSRRYTCKGLSEDDCKKKIFRATLWLIKEDDGKWYIEDNQVG